MKKRLLFALATLMVFTLSACKNSKEKKPEPTPSPPAIQSSEPIPFTSEPSQTEEGLIKGTFYDLEEAYEQGEISDNELLNICYRNNRGVVYKKVGDDPINFDIEEIEVDMSLIQPIEPLDKIVEDSIKNDYFEIVKDDPDLVFDDLTPSDIRIDIYCGLYNGYYAFRFDFNSIFCCYPLDPDCYIVIGDLVFSVQNIEINRAMLWRPNK